MTKTNPPRGVDPDKLNRQQSEFCEEYVANKNNGTQAYKVVYKTKSENAAAVNASKLLKFHKIQKRIAQIEERIKVLVIQREADQAQRWENRQIDVVRGLMQLAYTPMTALCRWGPDGVEIISSNDLTPAAAMSVKEVKVKRVTIVGTEGKPDIHVTEVKLAQHDKVKPLELLGQNRGMFEYATPLEKPYAVLIPVRRAPGKTLLTTKEKKDAKDA